ncbi:MAG: c-type cytochrome [Xanthomonadales bacterium]|nr:cytochrome c [Xanthomonadales bacterium]NIX11835.1 c-type cytochrome [Xanthomonadales bacterium]
MKSLSLILLTALIVFAAPAMAADPAAGKAKSTVCAACHGADGMSVNPMWPHLAGQQEMYLAKQMRDFRDGNRKDPVMSAQAASLSDDDIANLAAYYASLK